MAKKPFTAPTSTKSKGKDKLSDDPIKGLKNAIKSSQVAGLAKAVAEHGFRG